MTRRLYYDDSYLTRFSARIVDTEEDGRRVYLDSTAFYPASGGQPPDRGTIGGVPVIDVVDEGERIAHVLEAAVTPGAVDCAVDWARRFDHMQQHTGQHLLSAVIAELYGIATVSFHLGAELSTIDVAARAMDAGQLAAMEKRVNELVFENRRVTVTYEGAAEAAGLRKASDREGTLRIVEIEGIDRSACGGTHVRHTGEIGPVQIRKLDRVRDTARLEFVCGMRAVARARADFDALTAAARHFSAPANEVPQLVAAQIERLAAVEKERKKLAAESAVREGRELYENTSPGRNGVRAVLLEHTEKPGETDRLRAQSFAQGPRAVLLLAGGTPPAVLLAASPDSGMNAGETLKAWLGELGGRGGGAPQLAQGSLPSPEAGERLKEKWRAHWEARDAAEPS